MNFWSCKLVNLSNQKSSSYWQWQQVCILSYQSVVKVPKCFYCLNCPEFDELILMKIVKIVATRCQIFRLKCTKFNFGWDSAPDPAGGAYSAPQIPGALLLRAGEGGEKREEGKGRGREGKARGEEGEGSLGPQSSSQIDAPGGSSGHLCSNESFMTMDNISVMCCCLRYVAS